MLSTFQHGSYVMQDLCCHKSSEVSISICYAFTENLQSLGTADRNLTKLKLRKTKDPAVGTLAGQSQASP